MNTEETIIEKMKKKFIFVDEIQQQLEFFLRDPNSIPNPLCFWGEPGTGKTTFAKFLGGYATSTEQDGDMCFHFDMSALRTNTQCDKMAENIEAYLRYSYHSIRYKWHRCVILDEWHDIPYNQQGKFKVPLDRWTCRDMHLVILCLNASNEDQLKALVPPPILSRCHLICFNTEPIQKKELIDLANKRFPMCNRSKIETLLPDIRKIEKIHDLQNAKRLYEQEHSSCIPNTPN